MTTGVILIITPLADVWQTPPHHPSGLHHCTSVLWLHAKKADFPPGKTQLLAAAEESLCSAGRHTCLSPENISQSTNLCPITSLSPRHNLFVSTLSQYLGPDAINWWLRQAVTSTAYCLFFLSQARIIAEVKSTFFFKNETCKLDENCIILTAAFFLILTWYSSAYLTRGVDFSIFFRCRAKCGLKKWR